MDNCLRLFMNAFNSLPTPTSFDSSMITETFPKNGACAESNIKHFSLMAEFISGWCQQTLLASVC